MTYEEAYVILEDFQREMTMHREAFTDDFVEAHEVAILAIDKQIPKKSIHKNETFLKHDWIKNSDGSIDEWALDCGFHNGPMCKRCGHSFCVNCVEDVEKELSASCEHSFYACPTCGEEVDYKEHRCKCGQSLTWE